VLSLVPEAKSEPSPFVNIVNTRFWYSQIGPISFYPSANLLISENKERHDIIKSNWAMGEQ
jgi:hypothetical protein